MRHGGETQSVRARMREIYLLAHFLNSHNFQDWSEAWSLELYLGLVQGCRSLNTWVIPCCFPGALTGSWMGLELVPLWDTSVTGTDPSHYATMLAPRMPRMYFFLNRLFEFCFSSKWKFKESRIQNQLLSLKDHLHLAINYRTKVETGY